MSRKAIAATAAFATAAATLIAAPAADAAGRGTTHVHATKKHTVIAQSTLRPGLIHLHNDGSRPIAIFRKKHDGAADLVKYMNANKDSVAKRAFTRFGFVEILQKHADDYVKIARGTYYLVDVSGGKAKLSGVRPVAVRGTSANVHRPTYRSLRISSKGIFSGASTGAPRPYLRLRTSSHALLVGALHVKSSVTDAELRDALADKSGEKLFDIVDVAGAGFNAFLGAHQDLTVRTALARGRYILTAFAVDGANTSSFLSRPHLLTLT